MKYQFEVQKKVVPVTRENALAYWHAWELMLKAAGAIKEEDRINPGKVLAMYPEKVEEAHA